MTDQHNPDHQTVILVTGASGNVGGEVLRQLLERADPSVTLRITVRPDASGKKRASQFPDTVETVPFDFIQPHTFAAAFAGVKALFLMRPPGIANISRDMQPAIEAARAAGVEHVVFLSLLGVEHAHFMPHYKIEEAVRASGMTWTFLRAGFFNQNLTGAHLAEIRDQDELVVPAGRGLTSFIDVRDIAAVGVRALTEAGHAGRIYDITGQEALSMTDVTQTLSEVLGRPIRYRPSWLQFARYRRSLKDNWGTVAIMTVIYTTTRLGMAKAITDDVERLLGRPPITFNQFVHDFRAVWQ